MSKKRPPAGAMQIILGGRTYDATGTFDRLPLRDILLLERETAAFGRPMKWSAIRELVQGLIDKGIAAEAAARAGAPLEAIETVEGDDDWPWYLALLVWSARRLDGDDVTFDEAVDFPMSDLRIEVDEAALEGFLSPDPQRARPGSGRAGAKRPADRKRSTKRTSPRASSRG